MDDVRFLSANLAIENGKSVVRLMPDGNASISEYVAIQSREGDAWKLAIVRTVRSEPASPEEHLQSLAWLVGE